MIEIGSSGIVRTGGSDGGGGLGEGGGGLGDGGGSEGEGVGGDGDGDGDDDATHVTPQPAMSVGQAAADAVN